MVVGAIGVAVWIAVAAVLGLVADRVIDALLPPDPHGREPQPGRKSAPARGGIPHRTGI